jgi:hypothetical protein
LSLLPLVVTIVQASPPLGFPGTPFHCQTRVKIEFLWSLIASKLWG